MTFWLLHSKSPSPPNEMLNARQNPVFYDIWHYLPYLVKTSIHRSMGSAPVGAQCPFASSLGEFLGYRDWLWYPGLLPVLGSIALPFAFHISPSIFLFTLHLPLDFIRLFFTVAVSAPHHQPSSLFQTGDWHYGNWISEKVEIPWWWSL